MNYPFFIIEYSIKNEFNSIIKIQKCNFQEKEVSDF